MDDLKFCSNCKHGKGFDKNHKNSWWCKLGKWETCCVSKEFWEAKNGNDNNINK